MLFLKRPCLVLANFSLVFAILFVTSCSLNISSPEQINGIKEVKFATDGANFDPLWDLGGDRIIVNNYNAPMSKIYLFDLEHSKTVLLYETNGSAVAKDWTPDGKLVTVFIDAKDKEGIWNIDPNASQPIAFITTGHEASWSPDGVRLAVLDNSSWIPSGENTEKLRIIDMQDKKENIVFEVKGKDLLATGLSWAPSGEYIAFSLNTDHQSRQIYILNVDTQVATKITDGENDHWSPTWSPDSQLISYVIRSPKTLENSIVISTMDGKCKVPILGITDIWSVAWSPNGKQLMFNWRNAGVYLADLDTVFERDILTEGINCS